MVRVKQSLDLYKEAVMNEDKKESKLETIFFTSNLIDFRIQSKLI